VFPRASLVPELCLGTHFPEAPLRVRVTASRQNPKGNGQRLASRSGASDREKHGDFFGARPKKVRSRSVGGTKEDNLSPFAPLLFIAVGEGPGMRGPHEFFDSPISAPPPRTPRPAPPIRNSRHRKMLQQTGKLIFLYKQISARIRLCVEHGLRRAWNACRELENPPQPLSLKRVRSPEPSFRK